MEPELLSATRLRLGLWVEYLVATGLVFYLSAPSKPPSTTPSPPLASPASSVSLLLSSPPPSSSLPQPMASASGTSARRECASFRRQRKLTHQQRCDRSASTPQKLQPRLASRD